MCYGQEISNALVRARKKHSCDWCSEPIEPKTKYWKWFGIVDGDPSATKMHPECEAALAEANTDSMCWILNSGQPRGGFNEELDTFW